MPGERRTPCRLDAIGAGVEHTAPDAVYAAIPKSSVIDSPRLWRILYLKGAFRWRYRGG
ncbi:MAG: hypothetical protein GX165_05685 [Firmicutes bacterium]|nr:hypothetical protein [Bacillota bacterium]